MPTRWPYLLALLLLPSSISAVTLDCENVRDDGVSFNLKELGGPKTVHKVESKSSPAATVNTTFTINICRPLLQEGIKKDERCQSGTRVCARTQSYRPDNPPSLDAVIEVAGDYTASDGSNRALNPKLTRLKGNAGNSEGKEGVIVEMHGGMDKNTKVAQKAVVEFLCDKDLTGNEGFEDGKGSVRTRADDDTKLPNLDKGKSLQFVSYEEENETKVLRLLWKTKFACEDAAGSGGDGTGGWGFFTWLIIIVFLLAAAYIIFGSWLNYNRYGARGWDLIPHGDTIRDIPYIIKDWTAGFGDKLKGQSSRGGYSAV